jgi:hypothetical protein
MHNYPCEPTDSARRFVTRRGSTVVGVLLLSLGVGASTAAFSLVNGVMPHSASFVTCETTMEYTSDLSNLSTNTPALAVPTSAEMQERISDVYDASYEAAGEAVDSWSDAADQVDDIGDVGGRIVAVLLSAGALALLVFCTRGAARVLGASRSSTLFVVVALGALPVAALLASVLGLQALGLRAVAFMVTVSVVAAYWARTEQKVRVA